jgi:hypothetical protein
LNERSDAVYSEHLLLLCLDCQALMASFPAKNKS